MAKLLYFLTLLGLISTAFAIKCYECDSSKNIGCSIGFLSPFQNVVDCDAKTSESIGSLLSSFIPKNCIKITAKDGDNNEYVARGCGVNTGINLCDAVAKSVGFMSSKEGVHDVHCSECNVDQCNSAVTVGASLVLSVLAACFLFLF